MDNKALTNRAQKASLYGWFGGSLCTIVLELYELAGEAGAHGTPCTLCWPLSGKPELARRRAGRGPARCCSWV